MDINFSFSEQEKRFFEIYTQLLEKYFNNPHRLNLFLELKALELSIENPKEVLEKINSFLRDYLFFEDQREELSKILRVDEKILEILKRYPYFVEYRADYGFPSEDAIYRGFKWREPLILAGGNDGKVRIWRVDNGEIKFLFSIGEEGSGFPAYELYDNHLFYSNGPVLKVYYLPSGKVVEEIEIGQSVYALNLEGNNLYLYQRLKNTAIRQRVELDNGKVEFGPAEPISVADIKTGEIDMIAVGKRLVKLKRGRIYLLEGGKKQDEYILERDKVFKVGYPINDILLSGESAILAVDGSAPFIVDIQSGEILGFLEVPVKHSFRIRKNPVKDELAISHSNNLISVWNLKTLESIKILESYFIDVLCIDFSPDGKWLVAAGEGRDINVWDTETWEMVKDIDFDFEGVTALTFSPDGKYLAAGGGDNNIYLLTLSDGEWKVEKTLSQHEDLISDLLFVEGKLVSSGWDGKVILWNPETGEVERVIQSSDDRVWKLALSKDGGLLAVADWEGKVNVYKTADWERLASFEDQSGVTAVSFGEGKLLIGRKDGTLEVVNVEVKAPGEVSVCISQNPSEETEGITTFNGNILVYTKGRKIKVWNSEGEKVFSATVEGSLKDTENMRKPQLEMKVLPETFVVRREDQFYGAKGWEEYVNILKGLELVKEKEPFLRKIANPDLLKEL